MKMSKATPPREYIFTINNYTETEWKCLNEIDAEKITYMIAGKEIGPKCGTPHIQGYIRWKHPKTMSALSKIPGFGRAHLTIARGDDFQNQTYCSKEGEWFEKGEPKKQGKRNDLLRVKEIIDTGGNLRQCFEECFEKTVKHTGGIIRYIFERQEYRETDDPPPKVIWRWGKSDTFKTRWVWLTFGKPNVYQKRANKWWDGYNQQQVILIDDFNGKWEFRDFLQFLDQYQYMGDVKYGHVKVNSKIIVITCEFHPRHFWGQDENLLYQVTRRCTEITEVKKPSSDVKITEKSEEIDINNFTTTS